MPISVPKRRNAFVPIGKLRGGSYGKSGKHGAMANLNLTPMVDMFTTIVIFLIQLFSATGDILFAQEGLKLPPAKQAEILEDRGPVITLFKGKVIVEGRELAKAEDIDEAEPGIPPLTEYLTGVRERDEKLFGRDPNKPFDGKLIIQADKETDFMMVRKAIYAGNMSGWAYFNFTVVGEGKPAGEGGEGGEAAEE
jgi:hypothetical protein